MQTVIKTKLRWLCQCQIKKTLVQKSLWKAKNIQFSSVAQLCPTLCNPLNRSTPGLPVHHHLPEFTQTQVHQVGDDIQPSHPLSSPSPPAPNHSQHQDLFQWINSLHEVAKVSEFQLQHRPCNEHPKLISFRMDWLDLLAVQGTLKSLLQHHSLQASILWHSAFFTVQLSHPHMTTGQGMRLRWATPRPRSGVAAERSNPTSKERWLCGRRRAKRSYSTFKVRRGSREKIPLIQDKEQRLHFAGGAVKR